MRPYTNGTARVRVDATGEVITVIADQLDWEQDGFEERDMGGELRYVAEVDIFPKIGGTYSISWELYEYPIGIENMKSTIPEDGLTVIQNFSYGLEHEPDSED